MPTYLAEVYAARSNRAEIQAAVERAATAATAMTAAGHGVRHLHTIFAPRDETCFHLIEAENRAVAVETLRRAHIDSAHVTEAETFP